VVNPRKVISFKKKNFAGGLVFLFCAVKFEI
jgi:hypothetical protein